MVGGFMLLATRMLAHSSPAVHSAAVRPYIGACDRRSCRPVLTETAPPTSDPLAERTKLRLAWAPWLVSKWKVAPAAWYVAWQAELQADICLHETVFFGDGCFVAPSAVLTALERNRIVCEDRSAIAADCYLRGPIRLGKDVVLNARCHLHGGAAGIRIGAGSRVATGVTMFAYNHGLQPGTWIKDQPTTSRGIDVGVDVWIGANAGIVDGVTVGDHAVIGMGSIVTKNVAPWSIVAGNPARVIGDRRTCNAGDGQHEDFDADLQGTHVPKP
jgi:acetyltransferase-like isoleucine patch superfamily enzyme